MECIEILRREHRVVTLVADAAHRRLDDARSSAGADELAEVDRYVDFFRYYTIACHDPKEEDLLFAALHHRGMSWDGYPLHALMDDHAALRRTLDAASDDLTLARAGDFSAVGLALAALEDYLELLVRHVETEEEILFPIAERWLSDADFRILDERFEEVACDEADEGMQEYYTHLAHDLAGTAAATAGLA